MQQETHCAFILDSGYHRRQSMFAIWQMYEKVSRKCGAKTCANNKTNIVQVEEIPYKSHLDVRIHFSG